MDFLDNVAAAVPAAISSTMAPVLTNAEKQLRPILFDEGIQVLSNFELNQVASLTYNDMTLDGIFELIGRVCSRPLDHTPLTIQKSLVTTKHVLIYGSEKTVNHAYGILEYFKALLEFNTVLMTQKQGGAMSFFQSLQGGGVDKGGPIRDAAGEVVRLLSNINELRRIRTASASQDSLVPVGDDGIAFVTDNVRLHILKRKIAEEKQIRIQSNLKKSEGGWGAGYASANGKSVVGAAHGIEEMIKMANLQTKLNKFSDDDIKPPGYKTEEEIILEELKAEADATKAEAAAARNSSSSNNNNNAAAGMFSYNSYNPTAEPAAAPEVDLLDFGGSSSVQQYNSNLNDNSHMGAAAGDLLGGYGASPAVPNDPFSSTFSSNTTTNGLLDLMVAPASTPALDPFAVNNNKNNMNNMNNMNMNMNMNMNLNNNPTMHMHMPVPTPSGSDIMGMNSLSSGMTNISFAAAGSASSMPPSHNNKGPMMALNKDRFSALDALASNTQPPNALDAKNAENRLLGFTTTASTLTSNQETNYSSAYNNNNINNNNNNNNNMMYSTGFMQASASVGSARSGIDEYNFSAPMGNMPPPSVPENMIASGAGRVSKAYGDSGDTSEDDPWVMGGTTGSGQGLVPVGPQPSAPPPPPPPC
jgi:hypothetical protein